MPAPLLAGIAQQAEAQGLAGIFAAQVYGPPWIPLAAAAAVTERIQLASGIAIASARSPFETAMAAIDMDRISGGRFTLGLGASVHAWSRGIFGAPEHKPLTHLRETVAAVRHIVRGAHRGLEPFEGQYYRADFASLQPTAPPLREEIPIWIAALRGPAVRLAAEIADGVMGHPMWSIDWAVERIQPDLAAGLAAAGRKREDVELNLWLWCVPNDDEAEAIEDSRTTVAFYAAMKQYESFFEAHGFGEQARQLQQHVEGGALASHAQLVPDEMVRTFVLCGKPDAVRERVERAWTVADSLCLVPPVYGLSPEKLAFYTGMTAKLFYE
ncbi:MAG: LLM class flavin-dependent oxidoreductase [Planctomycetota bacterium]|jgi:probable F420-dependent oxidoreductase